VAKTNWLGTANFNDIVRFLGHLPTADMLKIMNAVKKN
jgi:hypothetical protein